MSFNAGSIIGSLDLDRDPFTEGLRLARQEGEDFEDSQFTATADVDAGDAFVALDDLEMRVDELDGRNIDLNVEVDGAAEAEAELRGLRTQADGGTGRGGLVGAFSLLAGPGSVLKTGLVSGGILTALGGLQGLLAASTGAALGLGGALTIAGSALVPFGLIAKSDFADMNTALKDLTKQQQLLNSATTDAQRQSALKAIAADTKALQGPAGVAAKAFQEMQGALAKLKTDTAGSVFGVLGGGANLIAGLLPKLAPLINSTGGALSGIIDQLSKAIASPGFTKFINFLSTNIGPILQGFATALGTFGAALGRLLENSGPLIDAFLKGLNHLADSFSKLVDSPGMKQFIATIVNLMPVVGDVLNTIGGALVQVFIALEPAVAPALDIIKLLAQTLGQLAPILGPLITDFLTLLETALIPLSPLLLQLAQDIVPPLESLFAALAPLVPVIAGAFVDLVEAVLPLVPLFAQMVTQFLPPLVRFLDELIREGIMPLAAQLVTSLAPVLPKIAKSFGDILDALVPLLPLFVGVFTKTIIAIAPTLPKVAQALASLVIAFSDLVQSLPPDTINAIIELVLILSGVRAIQGINALSSAVSSVAKAVSGLVGGLSIAIGAVRDFFEKLPGRINGWVGDLGGLLTHAGGLLMNGFLKGIKIGWDSTTKFVGGMKDSILAYSRDSIHWLYDAGKNALYGLLSGMKNGLSDTVTWVAEHLGSSLVDGVKHALHISSPSRLMADEVGKWIPWGIAAGIDENSHAVTASMQRLAGKISGGNIGAMSGKFAINGQLSLSPAERAQINSMAAISSQLGTLISVTKELPAQTGDATASGLKPVLAQQGDRNHQQALMRGRSGAVGFSGG